MVRSLVLGLVLTIDATVGKVPPGEGQATMPQTLPLTAAQDQNPPATPSLVPLPKRDPFLNVFRTMQAPTPAPGNGAQNVPTRSAENPRVLCGLTMWQVDPNTDPKIRPSVSPAPEQTPGSQQKPDFKIRRIIPTLCRE